MFAEDLSVVQKFYEENKMKIIFEVTYYTYRVATIFSLATTGRGNVLAVGNHSKKRDT